MVENDFNKECDLNILILSCGTRNKIVRYFRQELNGRGLIFATDCSRLAPALYEADRHFIVPRIDSDDYLEVILDICKKNEVKAILSLIDPELIFLAKHKKEFMKIGVLPIISDHEVINLCYDKYRMSKFLVENGFLTAKSYTCKEKFLLDIEKREISYPVFVKPIKGSASLDINKVFSRDELELLFDKQDDFMIQEYMNGTELGVDAYIDLISGVLVSVFIKEKIKMRAGETDKSVSIKDGKLFQLIDNFVKKMGLKGIIDIDLFRVNDEYYISEVNPRFGGGYLHAHECGVNMIEMLINNVQGKCNINLLGKYNEGVYMMKYCDVCMKTYTRGLHHDSHFTNTRIT